MICEMANSTGEKPAEKTVSSRKNILNYGDSGQFQITEISNCTCNILKIIKVVPLLSCKYILQSIIHSLLV